MKKLLSILLVIMVYMSSCTNMNISNVSMWDIEPYIEKKFGANSPEYNEYQQLNSDYWRSREEKAHAYKLYGEESREHYLAVKGLLEPQQNLLSYFKKIGATQAYDMLYEGTMNLESNIKLMAEDWEFGPCSRCGKMCVEGNYYYTGGKYYYDAPHCCGKCQRKSEVKYLIDVLEGRAH